MLCARLAICDCDENATMQIAYGYGLFTGGLGAHRGGETAGCAVIPISSGNTKRQIQMLKDMQVDVLACTRPTPCISPIPPSRWASTLQPI